MGTVNVFGFEIDIHGARVTSYHRALCAGCTSNGEIDANIRLLKADLDAVAKKMKVALKKQQREPVI